MNALERYLAVTNAKRLKRSADEMDRGLTPEQAAQERLDALDEFVKNAEAKENSAKMPKPPKSKRKRGYGKRGQFTITFKMGKDVDPDYADTFEGKSFEIELDNKFMAWFNTKMDCPYDGNMQLMLEHIVDMGIGEVITTINFPDDLAEHIRLTTLPGEETE